MDDIENYQPRGTEVVSLDRGRLEIYCTDPVPEHGEAVALSSPEGDTLYAVVRRHLGGNRIRAAMPELPDWVEAGTEVSTVGERAGFRVADGRVTLGPEALAPESRDGDWFPIDWRQPEFADVTTDTAPIDTGYEGVDAVAPPVAGALNLVIDRATDGGFDPLAERIADALELAETLRVTTVAAGPSPDWVDVTIQGPGDGYGYVFALRAAVALAAHRRDAGEETLVIADLPEVGRTVTSETEMGSTPGYGELVDRIGSGLVSTDSGRITGLLRLPVPARSDIGAIVETLDVGDVAAQLFIDTDGRFAPDRSSSDAPLDDERRRRQSEARDTLRRAEQARDTARLLGNRELSQEQRTALERADALRDELA